MRIRIRWLTLISFVAGLLAVGVALFPINASDAALTTISVLHVALPPCSHSASGGFWKGSELCNIWREELGLPPMSRPADPNEPTMTKQALAIDARKEES